MAPKRGAKAAPPEKDPESMTLPELKDKLKELGYGTSGSKAVLVDRLITCVAAAKEAPAPKKGAAKAKAEEPEPPAPKRGAAKAEPEPPAPKRGAAKAKAAEPEPPAPKRGAAKAEPEPPAPKRGAAKAEPEPPAPKRGAKAAPEAPPAKRGAAAAAEPEDQPVSKRGKAEAKAAKAPPAKGQGEKRKAEGAPNEAAASSSQSPAVPPEKFYFEDGDFSAEYAKSSRSECRKCRTKIMQGELRIGKQTPSDKFDGNYTVWQKWACFLSTGLLPRTTQMIQGFSTLRPEDQEEITKYVPASASTGDAELDEAIKTQNKKVYEVIDALSPLSDNQLKEMCELNEYPTKKFGTTATIRDLCADGIMFGATEKCEVCKGSGEGEGRGGCLLLHGEGYRCRGWVSEFLKCTFKTQKPGRTEWQLTEAALQIPELKKITLKTGERMFAAEMRDDEEIAAATEKSTGSQKKPPFLGLTFMVLDKGDNKSKEELEKLIQDNAGTVVSTVSRAVHCIVSHKDIVQEDADDDHEVVAEAKQSGVPGTDDLFITSSAEAGILQDMTSHLLWGEARTAKKIADTKTKFIDKMGVNMDSDVGELAGKAHVLVDMTKKCVYSEMLTKTDLVSGSNSFYTIHLLESDDGGQKNYWVFMKWGRIGVSQGGTKVVEHGTNKTKAIHEFTKKYLDQTGNTFGDKDFVVKPGKFCRIELEHKALSKKKNTGGEEDASAGGEAEGGDQPLGKLSKAQIEKGQAVLDKVDKLLDSASDDAATKAKTTAEFYALSAEFYTMVPHNFGTKKPPVINNAELLGAEKALLAFYLRMGFEEMDGEEEAKLTPIGGVMDLPLPATLHDCSSKVCADKDIKSCVTKGATMHKKKAGKPQKPMTADLYGAILLYTSNAIYKQLNKALRDEDRSTVSAYFSYLRFLFEACARLPQQKKTLWRGIGCDLYPTYKVGSTIIWWGVSSCTSDESVARGFMAGCGDGASLLIVETQTACDIAEVSFFANEAESILLPGTQLEVISSKKTGKKSEIRLREVGRVVS